MALNNLATVSIKKLKYDEAKIMRLKALKILQKAHGEVKLYLYNVISNKVFDLEYVYSITHMLRKPYLIWVHYTFSKKTMMMQFNKWMQPYFGNENFLAIFIIWFQFRFTRSANFITTCYDTTTQRTVSMKHWLFVECYSATSVLLFTCA